MKFLAHPLNISVYTMPLPLSLQEVVYLIMEASNYSYRRVIRTTGEKRISSIKVKAEYERAIFFVRVFYDLEN